MKTFCFKLYKSEHNVKLHTQINAAALTFNHCIALHNRYYKLFGKFLNQNKLKINHSHSNNRVGNSTKTTARLQSTGKDTNTFSHGGLVEKLRQ